MIVLLPLEIRGKHLNTSGSKFSMVCLIPGNLKMTLHLPFGSKRPPRCSNCLQRLRTHGAARQIECMRCANFDHASLDAKSSISSSFRNSMTENNVVIIVNFWFLEILKTKKIVLSLVDFILNRKNLLNLKIIVLQY